MEGAQFEERQINLSDIIWRLAEQWRGVLLAGIVFAVVAAVFALSAETPEVADIETEPVQEKMTEQYRKSAEVLSKYASYMWQTENYETSFWNTNDYKDAVTDTCIFRFASTGRDVDISTSAAIYASIVNDDKFNDALLSEASTLWEDINRTSLYQIMEVDITPEMFSDDDKVKNLINNDNAGLIKVTMLLPGKGSASEWEAALCEAVNIYYSNQNEISDTEAPELVYHSADRAEYTYLSKKSDSLYEGVAGANASYNTAYNALNSDTKDIVSQIIDEAGGSVNISDYITVLDEKFATVSEKQEGNGEADNSRKELLKYIVLGFILGCVIYAGVYVTITVLRGIVLSEDDLKDVTDISSFGGIYEYPYRGTIETFLHDKGMYKYRTRHGKTISHVTADVITRLKYRGNNRLTVISLGTTSDRVKNLTEEQINILEKDQIEVDQVNIEGPLEGVRESTYVELECVLIEVIGGKTKWRDLGELNSKLSKYNIYILGYEYIES